MCKKNHAILNAIYLNFVPKVITVLFSLQTSDSANLDFENVDTYIIRVVAKDDGKPSLSCEKSVIIRVQNENEAPWNIRLSSNKVTRAPN